MSKVQAWQASGEQGDTSHASGRTAVAVEELQYVRYQYVATIALQLGTLR